MEEDGLLPAIPEDQFEWLRPQIPEGADREEKVALILQWIGDIQTLTELVWPAEVAGKLERPPNAHMLDQWVREQIIWVASTDIQGAAEARPRALTVGAIARLPDCDACSRAGRSAAARYDTTMKGTEMWSNLCPDCYRELGPGRLGTGIGQYMVTWDEVGEDLRDAYRRAKAYWAGRGVDIPAHDPWP